MQHPENRGRRFRLFAPWHGRTALTLFFFVVFQSIAPAATIIIQTNRLGSTPDLLAYNCGHFYPGSNTRDWWRYSGVSGARVFITPDIIEATDDIPGFGDGVTNQATFLARKAALRAAPLNTAYINWTVFTNGFARNAQHGSNILQVDETCSQLKRLGIEILVNIGASPATFPIAATNDWAGKWELWQHYYAEGFYLARNYDVRRYQMYNEPNISGVTDSDYLQRLQLASDAIQCAVADVNQLFGKQLNARVVAPVTAGSAISTYATWGKLVTTNRHLNFLNQTDTNFLAVHQYDYHQYNSTPSKFGTDLGSLNTSLADDLSPEPRFPVSISEFNVHTASTFDTMTETLDSPTKYSRFGAIVVNLAQNSCNELYVFKFSQTLFTTNVKKNGMHWVDNTNAPYNIGGITKAGEAWRLFNKAAAPGRDRLDFARGAGAENLDLLVARETDSKNIFVFCANQSTNVSLSFDFSAMDLPTNAPVLLEEVSEQFSGGGRLLTNIGPAKTFTAVQPSNTVWLLTVFGKAMQPSETVACTEDATAKDGVNKAVNFGSEAALSVRNSPTNTSLRHAALLKFRLPPIHLPDVQLALLSINSSSILGGQAHGYVYALTNNNWSETNVTWQNAPNLAQGVPAGTNFTNNVVIDAGGGALMQGEVVATGTTSETFIDVTEFVRNARNDVSFLVTRNVRFHGDIQDDDGLSMATKEGNPALAPQLKILRLRDTDGDGVGDETETGSLQTDPDKADSDGDGLKDGDELFAATDPRNPNSVFRIISATRSSTNLLLQWSTVTNRAYRVLHSTNLLHSFDTQIFSNTATNSMMSYTAGVLPGASFFRVEVAK